MYENENDVAGYHFIGWFYTNGEGSCTDLDGGEPPALVEVTTDAITDITFCNVRDTGDLIVHKIADTDGDGVYDTNNPSEFKWGTVSAESASTDMGTGQTLVTGNYNVYENNVPGYEFTGWFPGHPEESRFSCTNLPEGNTSLPTDLVVDEHTTVITLCNQLQNPILTISKTNDTAGDEAPGGDVLFTITVIATQSAAYNVVVTDLPAVGFTYHAGSWTANSSVRGNIQNAPTTEPTYASPGVWQLGDMVADEIVTLTYLADIAGDIKPGLYKDLVWAFGCIFETNCSVGDSNDVLASAVNPGFVSDNYAGTDVTIATSNQSGVSINVIQEGTVLGASTELPATGSQTFWLILALLSLTGGVGLVVAGKLIRRHYV